MIAVIRNPHDKLFKLSMEEPRVAHEFLSAHLPSEILTRINVQQVKMENHSFIDATYQETEADVIFSVPMKGGKGYIYLLLEHQSEIDPMIAFRLLVYRVRLMERHLKQYPDQPLPLIYSMVVYNGEQLWGKPIDLFDLFGAEKVLAKEWLFNPAQLLDLQRLTDEELSGRKWSGLIELALKNRKIPDLEAYLQKLIPRIGIIEQIDAAGIKLGKFVIRYVLRDANAEGVGLFLEMVQENLSSELRGEAMTLAEELRQIGLKQGMQRGEAALFTRLLKRRFHEIPEFYFNYIEKADADTLLLWGEKILDAKTLEEIFA
ncbi:MAG: Rpn family recombination-promoting nuclease/putative transposase [Proteobacteria bacterium]|nr:Rpn family recombination-promoting nuclease/putative transposase [Pseudomonadota bacterium]